MIDRRSILKSLSFGALAGASGLLPTWARSATTLDLSPQASKPRSTYDIAIGRTPVTVGGRTSQAMTFNGTMPGPLMHWREGDDLTLNVTNTLDEDTSVHWHGMLLPFEMDGVPGVNYPGIAPGETFTYRFRLKQSGSYWYHSHTAFQENRGLFGPIVIEPKDGEPFPYDRDYVIVLSDWPTDDPDFIYDRLKKQSSDYYNYQRLTVGDLLTDMKESGVMKTLRNRQAWGEMGMTSTDLLNVTDAEYTYALNGHAASDNWTALFRPGERIRLRFTNASAMTHFDVRIPGLPMTMLQMHGQYVEPVETDEFRIGVAESYDCIVQPGDRAYTIFCETLDRSGYTRGTLAPKIGMSAALPAQRVRPRRSLDDFGMGMMDDSLAPSGGMKPMPNMPKGSDVNVAMRVMQPQDRLAEPGVGLGHDGWRVLTYSQMRAHYPRKPIPPEREILINLTTNMKRYIFSFDGIKYSDAKKIQFYLDERLRLVLMNQSMMAHPIHLHGMWMELENGHGDRIPRVHTIMVKPGERLSVLITPVGLGDWAFHCHVLYHFHSGMFRVVNVAKKGAVKNA